LPGWLWILKELRNEGMHRDILKVQTHASFVEDITRTTDPFAITKVHLMTDPQTDLEVIPYLEDSLKKTRALIGTIIANEPLLKMSQSKK
jgi:hypothetical protein